MIFAFSFRFCFFFFLNIFISIYSYFFVKSEMLSRLATLPLPFPTSLPTIPLTFDFYGAFNRGSNIEWGEKKKRGRKKNKLMLAKSKKIDKRRKLLEKLFKYFTSEVRVFRLNHFTFRISAEGRQMSKM